MIMALASGALLRAVLATWLSAGPDERGRIFLGVSRLLPRICLSDVPRGEKQLPEVERSGSGFVAVPGTGTPDEHVASMPCRTDNGGMQDLLDDIERGALDDSVPLTSVFKTCLVLARKTGSFQLRD
jgi:hypothetical protein